MQYANDETLIGIDPESETVIIVFPDQTKHLLLSVEQAEAFAYALLQKANLIRTRQSN